MYLSQSEDGLWESLVEPSVDAMEKDERERVEVRLAVLLAGEVREDAATVKVR